jgi:hypothetical protein
MNEAPKVEEEDNVIPFKKPMLRLAPKQPEDGDWLSPLKAGTEFKCRDKTGRTPRWLVNEFTHCGKLKGDVLLSPTVTLNDPKSWFWVEPTEFCKQWEFRGVIEEPEVKDDLT